MIICGDSAMLLAKMPTNSVDLTVTSPPYDKLRTYNGFVFDFEIIAREIFRVTKLGGVVVWVVGDGTIKGSETGTSFKQALFFKDIGFNLHDTMIYEKAGTGAHGSRLAYWQSFEFMFVFSKGRPKTINLIADHSNKWAGASTTAQRRKVNGDKAKKAPRIIPATSIRTNVWRIFQGAVSDRNSIDWHHPAVFPFQLAADHIESWSAPGDIVLDPFMGSGTTALAAIKTGRRYLGFDISKEYVDLANKRIKNAQQ